MVAVPSVYICKSGGASTLCQHPGQVTTHVSSKRKIWLGAALAVPVTGVIRIILDRIPTTRPVAAWMAGHFDPLEEIAPVAPEKDIDQTPE